ncbi:MAG TPA: hypothetical protein PKJ84_14890 [Anaerolineales bacterium]|nr:hypothetical protein [Anaerolineales bacterium]HNO95460.1 hypothetical protein [Anaerolineales bacterium]
MKQNIKKLSVLAIILMLTLSACKANVSRNNDGSLSVETSVTQAQLQEIISSSIADPLIKSLTVTLQQGYVSVIGERERLNDASKTDTMSFRLDLGVSNGELTASISDAQIDGVSIEQNRVDHWNQTIANRIANIGSRNENAQLQSVSITPEQVLMTWTVVR